MNFRGLKLAGIQDTSAARITRFAIPAGREREAGQDILACLADGATLCLRNESDEGNEGVTFICPTRSGMVTKESGHGWQGDWEPTDAAGVMALVAKLAPRNRGGSGGHGSIIRAK
ncbi:hypothetical protein [Zavarzinella formosa]|uniref:hypothetical protein n=1 Tax=Zavarzinella formosa TaxID=360055 RepID=UPI0002D81F82|nr:hypothetical protein [Zavarzinella formosa]